MENKKINHWSFRGYMDNLGNATIEDLEEELTFIKQKNDNGTFDLAVMIRDFHPHIRSFPITPDLSKGYLLLEEISETEWKKISKEYVINKLKGEKIFRSWIKEKLYNPLNKDLYKIDWVAESMPYPDAPEELWEEYDKAYSEEFGQE